MKATYPGGFLITSLVTLIFLVHPKHNCSSVHWRFFSTTGGFLLTVVCENMIGVVALLLRLLDRDTAGMCSVSLELLLPTSIVGEEDSRLQISGSEISILLMLLDNEAEEPLLLMILLREDAAISVALFRLELLDIGVGVLHRLLSFLDRGLGLGFGVLDLLLAVLDKNLGLQMSSSTLLLSSRSALEGVVGSCTKRRS